jgi:hypothetical protein
MAAADASAPRALRHEAQRRQAHGANANAGAEATANAAMVRAPVGALLAKADNISAACKAPQGHATQAAPALVAFKE